jgi:hypothetical protein
LPATAFAEAIEGAPSTPAKELLAGAVVLVYRIAMRRGSGMDRRELPRRGGVLTDERGESSRRTCRQLDSLTWRSLPKSSSSSPATLLPKASTTAAAAGGFEGLLKIMEKQPVVFDYPG